QPTRTLFPYTTLFRSHAFQEAREFFGRDADILVNNAGIAESAKFAETTDEFWQRHIAVNMSGTFYCMRAALPSMVERGWGRIVRSEEHTSELQSLAYL